MDMIPNPAEMACIRAMPEMYRSIDARPDQMNTVIGCDPLNRINPTSYLPVQPVIKNAEYYGLPYKYL